MAVKRGFLIICIQFGVAMEKGVVDPVGVSAYRWVVLTIFVLVCIINFMADLEFSIIASVVIKYYGVEETSVDMTCSVFFIAYFVFFYPISFLIEKYSLKFTMLSAMALTLAGNLLKLLATKPGTFWIILLAQTLIAIGQVYVCGIPSKVATTWFGSEEVSTACAWGVFGIQLGSALACVISPYMITSKDPSEMEQQLFNKFLYQAILTTLVCLLVLIFFRSKPALPPSPSQLILRTNHESANISYFNGMKEVLKNVNFWLVVFSLGLANAIWNAAVVLENLMYTYYFPGHESDAGNIGLLAILAGGCGASMLIGVILDKTHRFKSVGVIILAGSALSYVGVMVSFMYKSRIGTYITMPLYGFFVAPVLIVGFEYLVEITYPMPETCSSSAFNAAYNFLSVITTYALEEMWNTVGHLCTFIVIIVILAICAVVMAFVKTDLKRRGANLQDSRTDKEIEAERQSHRYSVTF